MVHGFFFYTCALGNWKLGEGWSPGSSLVTVNISLVIDSNGDGMEKGGRKLVLFVWRIEVNIW